MNRYLLDSDVCIFAIRSLPEILERFLRLPSTSRSISAVTAYEIAKGIERLPGTRVALAGSAFLADALVLPVTTDVATAAAGVHERLRRLGQPIGSSDELIAGHAIALGLTLVTNNTKHFDRIPGLKLENWV